MIIAPRSRWCWSSSQQVWNDRDLEKVEKFTVRDLVLHTIDYKTVIRPEGYRRALLKMIRPFPAGQFEVRDVATNDAARYAGLRVAVTWVFRGAYNGAADFGPLTDSEVEVLGVLPVPRPGRPDRPRGPRLRRDRPPHPDRRPPRRRTRHQPPTSTDPVTCRSQHRSTANDSHNRGSDHDRLLVPAQELERRTIRRSDWVACNSAFIDCRTPGSDRKENYAFIGSGVSQNADQFINLDRAARLQPRRRRDAQRRHQQPAPALHRRGLHQLRRHVPAALGRRRQAGRVRQPTTAT